MTQSILRWALFALAAFAAGPLAWWLIGGLHAVDGGPDFTPLLSHSPIEGLLRLAAAALLAAAVGVATARAVGLSSALFNTGVVLAWSAAATGSLDSLLRASVPPGGLWRLSLEGLLAGIFAVATALAISAAARRRTPTPSAEPAPLHAPARDHAVGVVVAACAACAAAFLVAQNMLKGQAVATGAFAGIFAAFAAATVARRAAPAALVGGIALVAAAAPSVALFLAGENALAERIMAGRVLPMARALPLDWLAGAFLGLPIGRSMGGWVGEGSPAPAKAA